MTNTALKVKELKSREKIANQDRDLKEREFKHKRLMEGTDKVSRAAAALFTFLAGGKAAGAKANSPEFYKNYVKDLDKFTNLSTWIRNGNTSYHGVYSGSITGLGTSDAGPALERYVPGFAVLKWVPSLGNISSGASDLSQTPINQILMRTKEQILKSNSRSNVPYEAADIGYNLLATGSIIVAIGEYEKNVLIAQTYKADNAYYADAALEALGATASQWTEHLADARKNLILLKKRFNSAIVAPAGISLFQKWGYLATMWTKDSESSPAGVYTASASYYFKLSSDASKLEVLNPAKSTPDAFYQQISGMIQAIAENPDFQAMYADMRSAFTELFQLPEMFDENAILVENYDTMALEQLANIQTLPVIYTDSYVEAGIVNTSVEVHQDDNGYIYQGVSVIDQGVKFAYADEELSTNPSNIMKYIADHPMLNFHTDAPTGDVVLDATRFRYNFKYVNNVDNEYIFRVTTSDTAIIRSIQIRFYTKTGSNITLSNAYVGSLMIDTASPGGIADLETPICVGTSFDWLPLIQHARYSANNTMQVFTFGNVVHLVPFNVENIERLNQVCVLSQFYVDTKEFRIPGSK